MTVMVAFAGVEELPDVALDPSAGPVNAALRACGPSSTHEAARWLLDLPYGHNRHHDATAVFDEGHGTCVTKHATYLTATAELGLDLRLRWGFYALTDDIVSGVGEVLDRFGLPFVPTIHCFIGHGPLNVDLTEGNCNGKNRQITEYLEVLDVAVGTDEQPARAALSARLCDEDPGFAHVTTADVAEALGACSAVTTAACQVAQSKSLR